MMGLLIFLASLVDSGQVCVVDVSTGKQFEVKGLRVVDEVILYIDSSDLEKKL